MKRIIYFPLEPLKERYTLQLSAAETGWLERRWIAAGIPYMRIEGLPLRDHIKSGVVLDANGRGYWATSQIQKFLWLLDAGCIKSDDVLFFDDFWHPGISALPYSFALTGIHPKMFAFCYAQSVDPFDFTYPMREWMRHFEIGIGKILSGIFVTSTALKDSLVYAGIGTKETVHVTGLLYNSEEVQSHWKFPLPKKKNQVIYVSRWDKEKRPDIFLKIVDEVCKQRTDIKFVVSTSFKELKSNDKNLTNDLAVYLKTYPNHLELRENQTKEEYYQNLLESKVQINTADQDWVSWTLLEATTCGCIPLYPYFLSFPEALKYNTRLMYEKNDVKDAAKKVMDLIDYPTLRLSWVYERFDKSWERALSVMNGKPYEPLYG
jgi:glycosyltransferase involved in cell wall biosynthesis